MELAGFFFRPRQTVCSIVSPLDGRLGCGQSFCLLSPVGKGSRPESEEAGVDEAARIVEALAWHPASGRVFAET